MADVLPMPPLHLLDHRSVAVRGVELHAAEPGPLASVAQVRLAQEAMARHVGQARSPQPLSRTQQVLPERAHVEPVKSPPALDRNP